MPIFDPSTHNDLIDINITLSSLGSGTASLTTVLVLQDNILPGGGRYAEYASVAEVEADVDLGNLDSSSQSIADIMFGQANPPEKILFGQVKSYTRWQLTINTATDGETYGVDLVAPAVDINVVAGIGSTPTTIAAQFVAAWNANGTAFAVATAGNLAGVVTFTGNDQGDFTLTEDENAAKMTLVQIADSLEDVEDALDAVIGAGANFYGVLYESRTVSRQIALATDIESKTADGVYLLLGLQDDDADWLTSGIPAAWSSVEDYERTVMYYHDDNGSDASSDRLDAAHFADRLSWDPDVTSAGWNSAVASVDALETSLSQTQKGFARSNNANTALPMGTQTDTYVDPGRNLNGRPADHIVSADWLRARAQEAVADLIVAVAARGAKIPVDVQGQAMVGAEIEKVFLQGEDAGHFLDHVLVPQTITQADIDAGRIRFNGEATLTTGVRQVEINLFFDT